MKDNKLYYIVGCGSLGAHLAKTLSEKGAEVLIIDRDKKSFKKLGQNFGGLTVEGDAADLEFISELDVEKAVALVAVTEDDNINLMVCQIAKELYGIKVFARLYNSERESIYREFGIETICPEEIVVGILEEKMMVGVL